MPTFEKLKILLIDTDELLISDAQGLEHPEIEFSSISPSAFGAAKDPITNRDVIVCSIDSPRGIELVTRLCSDAKAPPVIALGGRGHQGRSLEHLLTLAELHGASLALPKPIDALEVAHAAVSLLARRKPGATRPGLLKDLERRLAC